MDLQELVDNIPQLSDLELAVLLSLIAKQHCLIHGDDELLDALCSELALVVSDLFSLSHVTLEGEDLQSVDKFVAAILDEHHKYADKADLEDEHDPNKVLRSQVQGVSFRGPRSHAERQPLDNRMVVNVIIAKHFNTASHDVQTQVMELIRRRRIYSKTTVHTVPQIFLCLPVISTSTKHNRLNHHLNDRIFMSHYHDPEEGFPNVEDLEHEGTDGLRPQASLSKSSSSTRAVISKQLLGELRQLGQNATMTPEIRRYLQDIVVFLRVERGVDGGITAYSNVCFVELAKYLAPLHGIDFVTPSLIALAARKIYPHRMMIASPGRERSMQFGSNVEAVSQYLDGLTPEEVIDIVLAKVECPL